MNVDVNPGQQESGKKPPMLLRERKRLRTRAAIQEAALRLIAEQGYGATTCEQIAAAAEVSPATFFRYFPTKDDVVLTDDYDPLLIQALGERPAEETPIQAVRNSLAEALGPIYAIDGPTIRARTQLIMSVPALRSRMYEAQREAEALLATQIAPRMAREPADLRVRVVTSAIMSALLISVESWIGGEGELPALMDAALRALEEEFAAGPPLLAAPAAAPLDAKGGKDGKGKKKGRGRK